MLKYPSKGPMALLVACLLLFLTGCSGQAGQVTSTETAVPDMALAGPASEDGEGGYRATVYVGDDFLACGTGGRLDRITTDGQRESLPIPTNANLTDIWADDQLVLVSGEEGTLLYSEDRQTFVQSQIGTGDSIFGVTALEGQYYAACAGGRILHSADGLSWEVIQLDTDRDIIAIAANSDLLMAITSESDVFTSRDGVLWDCENFNKTYERYYDSYTFTGITCFDPSFFIFGHLQEDEGVPFVMYSETGNVWIFKPLSEINGIPPTEFYPLTVNALALTMDQIVAACDNGRVLTITECSVCNQLNDLGEADMHDMAYNGDVLLVVGDGFGFDLLDESAFRQYDIQPEQAYADLQAGAVLVDVRTPEEYAELHAEGAVNIPLSELPERLPREIPDPYTEIIFYCSAGARSQAALEQALEMGYQLVYNMGKLEDWPFGTASGE